MFLFDFVRYVHNQSLCPSQNFSLLKTSWTEVGDTIKLYFERYSRAAVTCNWIFEVCEAVVEEVHAKYSFSQTRRGIKRNVHAIVYVSVTYPSI